MKPSTNTYRVGEASKLGVSVDAVTRFYRTQWKRRIALGLPSFYRWQFCAPPENNRQDTSCVILDRNDDIVGIMGVNKRAFILNGKTVKAAELTTWVISSHLQGRGLGFRMLSYLQQTYDVLVGLGITADALPLYMTSGFQFMQSIPRFVRVYDLSAISDYVEIDKLGKRLLRKQKNTANIEYNYRLASESDLKCFPEIVPKSLNNYIRNSATIKWRYVNHPFFNYEIYMIESQGGKAVVVLRVDDVAGMRIVHIVDCFGIEQTMPAAVKFVDDYCKENNASVADFYCTSSFISRHFRQVGWFSILDDKWFKFIGLFHPPEMRTPPTTSMVYWARNDMIDLMDISRLYLTKGDLDMDRPTIAAYSALGVVDEIRQLEYGKSSVTPSQNS
ncbi:MAG: GNAT family N-acetyltransferase [Rhodospirillales bacterium]|nr:GNAT family N-acetyltransferase [Rhodospirillales bacterium]